MKPLRERAGVLKDKPVRVESIDVLEGPARPDDHALLVSVTWHDVAMTWHDSPDDHALLHAVVVDGL